MKRHKKYKERKEESNIFKQISPQKKNKYQKKRKKKVTNEHNKKKRFY